MRLEFVRTYPDPAEDVWSALTAPERVARWFDQWDGNPATGSVGLLMTEDGGAAPQEVAILKCTHRPGSSSTCRVQTASGVSPSPYTRR
ncbi:MAG: SRPBCC domain-containing protein [Actinomycetota bacterium]|nr:SRPBCC domain-containing protein [Actinomycetota bacterium]